MVHPEPDRRWPAGSPLAIAIAALLGLLTVLWIRARPLESRIVNRPAALGALSAYAALAGTVLLSLTIVLSARWRIVERSTGGLDRAYRRHHQLGAIAFSLLALHPSLLAWRYAHVSWARAAELWRPDPDELALAAGQLALYGMAIAIAVTMWVAVRHGVLVWLQRLMGVLFVPAAWHVFRAGGDTSSYRPLRWYLIAVVAAGVSALVLHTFAGRLSAPHHRYRVESVGALNPQVSDLRLLPLGRPMSFTPGQFAFLRFAHQPIGGEAHPYSMASSPDAEQLRFTIKHLGDYTAHIGEIAPGAEAVVEGPYGRFSYRYVRGLRQAWIAGGIGIAPFLSMAAALDPADPRRVTLFYGYADDGPPSLLAELRSLADGRPNLDVVLVDEHADGFIDAALLQRHLAPLDDVEFLLCGPPPMVHALHRQLDAVGVRRRRIHDEEFGFS